MVGGGGESERCGEVTATRDDLDITAPLCVRLKSVLEALLR